MKIGRKSSGTLMVGPRALAVISCALALLAATPVQTTSAYPARTPIVTANAPESPAFLELEAGVTGEISAPAKVATARSFSASRRLHILATMEMLHRWLTAELMPVEKPTLAIFVYEAISLRCFDVAVASFPVGGAGHLFASYERRFAIARCLLAPPTA